jgi:nicotinate-nucleotide adenylyltransferase
MRLGIFGGTFDPVHYGHLLLAECCREQLRLDQVWFLPAAVPPHKQRPELTPGNERAEMLELATGGHPAFKVCRFEIDRGGVNYTVDTLTHFRREHPRDELFFLMGADSLRDLPTWKDPARICGLATPVVVGRTAGGADAGASEPAELVALAGLVSRARLEAIRACRVQMPRIELSSSDIRGRVATGQSIRYRTPRAVEEFIAAHQLYRAL